MDGYVANSSFIRITASNAYAGLFFLRYDTYFFNDLPRLSQYFRFSNTSSLGELIRDFFIYYTDKFDYEEDVVSIRRSWQGGVGQQGIMKKEEKGWDEDRERDHNYICIEVGSTYYKKALEGYLMLTSCYMR